MRVRWTSPALRDLDIVGDHLAREGSPAASARAISTILDRADTLALHPHIGRPGRVPDTRELVVAGTPYIVPYGVRDTQVQILAAFHGARRWPEKFD